MTAARRRLGVLRDGTAVYAHSGRPLVDALKLEQEQDRAEQQRRDEHYPLDFAAPDPDDDIPPDADDYHAAEWNGQDPGTHRPPEDTPTDDPYADVPPPQHPPDETGPPALAEHLLTRSALRELPDPAPLIDNVIDQGTTALLYGKWGTGKSFIALDWAASVATGRAWQGRDTEQRRVLYVAAEGAFGLKARVEAWEQGWHTKIADDELEILPRPVNLTNAANVRDLAALIAWNDYGFVVVDTLARCMVGADENSAKDCGLVVDVLHRLRKQTPDGRGVVLGVHHAGKDGKTFRGSTTFEAGADTVYSVARDGAVIVVDREKRKDGPVVDVHRLKLDPIDGTGSVVIGQSHVDGTNSAADKLLSHFVSHFAGTGAYATQLRDVAEMPKTTFYRGLSELLKRGDLINEGTDKRPFYKVATK